MTMVHLARRTVIFTVDAAGIANLMDAAREDIPGLTTNRIVQTVANHNPDTFWAIARRDQYDISRAHGPLIEADDSVLVDTTGLSIDEVLERIEQLLESRK